MSRGESGVGFLHCVWGGHVAWPNVGVKRRGVNTYLVLKQTQKDQSELLKKEFAELEQQIVGEKDSLREAAGEREKLLETLSKALRKKQEEREGERGRVEELREENEARGNALAEARDILEHMWSGLLIWVGGTPRNSWAEVHVGSTEGGGGCDLLGGDVVLSTHNVVGGGLLLVVRASWCRAVVRASWCRAAVVNDELVSCSGGGLSERVGGTGKGRVSERVVVVQRWSTTSWYATRPTSSVCDSTTFQRAAYATVRFNELEQVAREEGNC